MAAFMGAVLVPVVAAPAEAAVAYKVLITGDSITQGSSGDYTWRYRLWNKLTSTEPGGVAFVGTRTDLYDNVNGQQGSQYYAASFSAKAHSALWGDAIQNELGNIGSQVASTGANVLVVMLGSNDLAYLTSPELTVANLKTYIQRARTAHPGIDVVVGEVVNRYDPWSGDYLITAQVNEYANRLQALVGQLNTSSERVVVAPTRTGWDAKTMTWDGTHPNPTGEALIAQRVSQGLAQVGIGSSSPDISGARSWDVAGPTPTLSTGSERMGIGWNRAPSGATGMFIEQRLTNVGEAWRRLPYAVAGDGWTAELLAAGGTYQYRVVPSKGFSIGVPGGYAQGTVSGPQPGTIGTVMAQPGGTSIYGGVIATAYWTESNSATGYLLSYRLQHNGTMVWDDLPYPVTQRNWDFQPLYNGRRYEFRIRGTRGLLLSPWASSPSTRMIGLPSGRAYAALGDSYSSGLGSSGEYDSACRRTSNAWPYQMQTYMNDSTRVLACVAATVWDVRTQLSSMDSFFASNAGKPQLITLTVGGNDVGWDAVLEKCIVGSCTGFENGTKDKMDALKPALVDLYNDIQAHQPYADVVVGGYPWVVEPAIGDMGNVGCMRLEMEERYMIKRLSEYLNQTISGAATSAGVWSVGQRVRDEFVGRNACQDQQPSWINGWLPNIPGEDGAPLTDSSSFHPSNGGQLAYAYAFDHALRYWVQ